MVTSRACSSGSTTSRASGTTAIWLTPSFKNKPVQGDAGAESAGYHGYWITDFTQIDPHLGTNADLKALVDAAHKRGIKVFFDIITNHTADVIDYPPTSTRHRHQRPVRLQGRRAVPRRGRQRRSTTATTRGGNTLPRRSTLRRRSRTRRRSAAAADETVEGPGLAERPDDVPQPRQHRRSPARTASTATSPRYRRPRRPVDRAARGRQRDDRHLQDLGAGRSASTASASTP